MKKLISVSVVIFLAVSLLILSPLAFDALGETPYASSDVEAYADGVFYYIDFDGSKCVYSDVPGTSERTWFTDYDADEICLADGNMYVSEGNRIHCVDMDTIEDKVLVDVPSDIQRFAYTGGNIYFLSDGAIYVRNAITGRIKEFLTGGITGFWLDSARELSYTDDNTYIHTVNLLSGKTVDSLNMWSDLGDSIPIKNADNGNAGQASDQDENIYSLQEKFPDGKYWNHTGSSTNNPNGWTTRPCTHHGIDGSGCNYSGTCGCNSFASAIQCMGYAFKCGYDVTGHGPSSGNGGWTISTDKNKLDYVKAGDVIRYKNDGHSIYVTGVFGDTITYTDCNSDGRCIIHWNKTVTKFVVRQTFTKIYISPFDAGMYQIQFDPNGGECDTKAKTVEQGMTYGELPTPEKVGYTFDGWFTAPEGGTIVTPQSIVDLRTVYRLYAHWSLIVYDIKYDANGEGTSKMPENEHKLYDETIELNNTSPERIGYTFRGWNSVPDGSGTKFVYKTKYADNRNLTLYAQWEANEYYITLEKCGGNCSQSNIKVTYDHPYGYGQKDNKLPVATMNKHNFDGWYTQDVGGLKITDDTIVKVTDNKQKLYARFSKIRYTVLYDANGGVGGPLVQTFDCDSFVTIPDNKPAYVGHDFQYWCTKADGTGSIYYVGSKYNTQADATLYAIWKIRTFDIAFDANGGSGAPGKMVKEYGTPLTLPNSQPGRTGYKFVSWNTKQDGSGTDYPAGGSFTGNSNTTLYAKWTLGNYKVTYLASGGKCDKQTDTFVYSKTYSDLPIATRNGYTFDGWYTERTGGTKIVDGDTVKISEDTYFYAHWKPDTYFVAYYDENGASLPANQIKEYNSYLVLSDKIPERTGFTFTGWNTERDGAGTTYLPGSVYTPNKTVVLYAQWKTTEYTIRYNVCGGTGAPGTQTKEYGKDVTLSSTIPQKDGYVFKGWNTAYDYKGTDYASGGKYSAEKSVTMYAEWVGEKVNVNLDATSGTCSEASVNVTVGDNFSSLPVPECDSKHFTGWFADEELTVPVLLKSQVPVMDDTTFYAGWTDTNLTDNTDENVYYAAFFADGKLVSKVQYTSGAESIAEPKVPEKTGYTGKWAGYSLSDGGVVVLADYEPVVYNAVFKADGQTVATVKYTVETPYINEPEIPDKPGYTAVWPAYNLTVGGITVNAQSTAVSYTVHFIAECNEIGTRQFTVESSSVTEPDVPEKQGYDGLWTKYLLKAEDVYSYAMYTPAEYEGLFTAEGKTVLKFTYTIEDESTFIPDVPSKTGYSGKWDTITLPAGGTEIQAIYTANTYNIKFIVDGVVKHTVSYTYGDESIEIPPVPEKAGYTSKWTAVTLGAGDSEVRAVFTPITYTVTFIADGVIVKNVPYTVETYSISVPPVPEKENMNGYWEHFELGTEDLTVNAVYTGKPFISLNGYKRTFYIYKNQSIVFTSVYGNVYGGMTVRWYIDGVAVDNDNKETYMVSKATDSFTVEVKVLDSDGKEVCTTGLEKVKVARNFFRLLAEFFKSLFGKPTIIYQ